MPWILGELQGAQLERLAADPTPVSTGRMYFNTVSNLPKFYDGSAWRTLTYSAGARVVTGSPASPSAITTAGITPSVANAELVFVQGSGGPVTVTSNPQIVAGATVGQELVLVGCDDTNTLTLQNGLGLNLNGNWLGEADACLSVTWDGIVWREQWRR